jgi:hypothetical protein
VAIAQDQEKTIVMKEIRYREGENVQQSTMQTGVVISIYDAQWKLLKNLSYSRWLKSITAVGSSLGYQMVNGKLHVLINAASGARSYKSILMIIDPDNTAFEKIIQLEEAGRDSHALLEAGATAWFGNTLLINQIIYKKANYNRGDYNSQVQKVVLQD